MNRWIIFSLVAWPAAGFIFVRQALRQAAIVVGLVAVLVLTGYLLFTEARIVMPVVAPIFALLAMAAFGTLFDFTLEQLERARIRAVLDKYVSANVATVVMESSDSFEQSLRGQKRCVTVLFSDIRSFTTMSETVGPEQLVGQLNEYFLPMVDAVLQEGGTLQKFIGDAIMAVWGDTHSLGMETDAAHAVRTALRMRAGLAALNAGWDGKGDRMQLSSGIGVNHGEVVVGEVGHPRRMEFTVLGDGVNLAARLESATKQFHCDILVGERAEELTRGDFWYRRVDRLRFKGKTQPIEVFIPLSGRSEAAPAWLEAYHAAVARYRERRFAEAAAAFREVDAVIGGGDFLCGMYAERCERYGQAPPDADWDGSHTLTEK